MIIGLTILKETKFKPKVSGKKIKPTKPFTEKLQSLLVFGSENIFLELY